MRLWLCLLLLSGESCILKPSVSPDKFIAYDHQRLLPEHLRRNFNNLIRRVHKEQWVIGYRYADNCPPAARNNGKAIEAAITTSLQAWLQPVRDLNTGKPVVADFRYVPNFMIKDRAELKLYDLAIELYCNFARSSVLVGVDEAVPPLIKLRRGTAVDRSFTGALLHEIGHAFGLLDTYLQLHLTLEELRVSKGGLAKTIGHQPASVMNAINMPPPVPTRISQDDANGIVWLYKFYHENLPLEDCVFLDYELEKAPDGCRPKYPLIFELKHNGEGFALAVIRDDENTDVNTKDGNGMTALQYAVIKGYPRLLAKLLAHQDIEVNSQDGGGMTALHYAVLQRNQHAVKALLAHKDVDIEVKDKNGVTAVQLATELKYTGLANLISPPPPVKEEEKMSVKPKGKMIVPWGKMKANK